MPFLTVNRIMSLSGHPSIINKIKTKKCAKYPEYTPSILKSCQFFSLKRNAHQSWFLEAPLVWQSDGKLKKYWE